MGAPDRGVYGPERVLVAAADADKVSHPRMHRNAGGWRQAPDRPPGQMEMPGAALPPTIA
ncbi:hypothetical protein GCM10011504_45070 [Siccirubricoccus deserti]|nr:hypothetical protein GCM10011504_45070 [Siccirubricoccus deserti]